MQTRTRFVHEGVPCPASGAPVPLHNGEPLEPPSPIGWAAEMEGAYMEEDMSQSSSVVLEFRCDTEVPPKTTPYVEPAPSLPDQPTFDSFQGELKAKFEQPSLSR